MFRKATVLYKEALAYYTVIENEDQMYSAYLITYKGFTSNILPLQLTFQKDRKELVSTWKEKALLSDLYKTYKGL